jgi:hypothetical protein
MVGLWGTGNLRGIPGFSGGNSRSKVELVINYTFGIIKE